MRISSLLAGFLIVGAMAAACTPATTYNRGMDMSFHPSGKADAQERLVNSAIELKQESDQKLVKDAGGIYIGELEVTAEKSTGLSAGATGGGATLSGRVSLEVANRGGTHFYLAKLDTENSVAQAQGPHIGLGHSSGGEAVQRTKARYVVYRVEQDGWAKLEKKYQPEAAAGATPPTAKASGGKDGGA